MPRFLHLKGKALKYAVALTSGLAFALQGYDQGVLGGLLTLESFVNTFPALDTVHTSGAQLKYNSLIQGTVVAILEVGALFGCWTCFLFGDRLGRRRALLLAMIIVVIGAAIQASSFSVPQLAVARVITGVGVGMATATVPIWVSECSKAHDRGSYVVIQGIFSAGGGMMSTWVDLGFYLHQEGSLAWRFPLAFQTVFAFAVICLVLVLPESPRWLIKIGKLREATEVLAALDDLPADSKEAQADVAKILRHNQIERPHSIRQTFQKSEKHCMHRMLLALGAQCFNQLTGIDALVYYAAIILQENLHLPVTASKIVAGGLLTWQFCCAFLPFFIVDKLGRRRLIIFGTVGMSISMCLLAGLVSAIDDNKGYQIGAVFFTFTFQFFFAASLLSIASLYSVEIVPLEIRAPSTGIAVSGRWLINFMIAEVTPTGFSTIGYRYYIVWACTNAAMALTVFLFFPETKGLSLEDVDNMFALSPGARAVVKHKFTLEDACAIEESKEVSTNQIDGTGTDCENMWRSELVSSGNSNAQSHNGDVNQSSLVA